MEFEWTTFLFCSFLPSSLHHLNCVQAKLHAYAEEVGKSRQKYS